MSEKEVITVADEAYFEDEDSKLVEVGGDEIAVFYAEGEFHAINNICPHQGGPLEGGKIEGKSVFCPWHAYEFDLESGDNPHLDEMCVETYPVYADDGVVYLEP